MLKKILPVFLLFIFFTSASAQSQNKNLNQLIVYGSDLIFNVTEPDGWTGNTKEAKKFHANIIFHKSNKELRSSPVLIQILTFKKMDEKTEKDLTFDVSNYKKRFKGLQEQEIKFSHPEYQTYSAHVFVSNKFHLYICYINPGPKFEKGLSVAMNIQKRDASDVERKDLQKIIASLKLFK